MQTDVAAIERVIISHWHSDHSGGLLSLLKYRNTLIEQKQASDAPKLVVDVHPDRPIARGIAPPSIGKVICRLAPDPTFEEIEAMPVIVEKIDTGHVVSGRTVYVSGEIPRVTEYEGGIIGGVRFVQGKDGSGEWVKEEVIHIPRSASSFDSLHASANNG